ncbi:hypothetical protein [Lysinibacillus capsici]|uniref:hypothetical protein n=1 Tax=Lysinibacillus capsici TaxID=2115968 RepID=UPI003BAA600A
MSRGFRQKTLEEISSESLFKFFRKNKATILCWHPPDGKAYFTPLYHFPEINTEGERTGRRNHIDLIFQIKEYLVLLEVKGEEKDFSIDINKLRNISKQYSIKELIDVLIIQGAVFDNPPTELVLALSSYDVISDSQVPSDMALFKATDNQNVEALNSLAMKVINKLKK